MDVVWLCGLCVTVRAVVRVDPPWAPARAEARADGAVCAPAPRDPARAVCARSLCGVGSLRPPPLALLSSHIPGCVCGWVPATCTCRASSRHGDACAVWQCACVLFTLYSLLFEGSSGRTL